MYTVKFGMAELFTSLLCCEREGGRGNLAWFVENSHIFRQISFKKKYIWKLRIWVNFLILKTFHIHNPHEKPLYAPICRLLLLIVENLKQPGSLTFCLFKTYYSTAYSRRMFRSLMQRANKTTTKFRALQKARGILFLNEELCSPLENISIWYSFLNFMTLYGSGLAGT